ncbi:2-hydroxycarboxylate transporter family protein [Klebsiella quasivariicola]|uniref:2-hydroxycarboxylate transporter family protein n=1 Tax=Klebsiella quasivariicola TaxID=2026240 RepID=UPI001CCA373B|nr:2-hydroxycarboxylate transporter family protein [Klebsiella quasivariicola]MBZ9583705.1 2-hydroxycarboxylate transporter family protein [Klebsiella quasivariicola]
MERLLKIKIYGIELPIITFFIIVVAASAKLNIIPNQLVGAIAIMFSLGIVLGELGERIPLWNKYCGGGAILAFLVCGLLKFYGILPDTVIKNAAGWMNEYNFLNLFIAFLIVGSVLGINRKMLIRSSSLFLPAILAGLVGAALLGILGGMLFGKSPTIILTAYVLPIMGGGAGAGAIPMAQIYSDVTGQDSAGYLSFALAILAVANIIAVIFAVILNTVGQLVPPLSGNGELMRVKQEQAIKEESVNITMDDIAAGIFLTAGFFILAHLMAKEILPTIFGVAIPNFAWLIIFATLANVFNLIPQNLKAGAQKCQQFCANKLIWIQMVGCGIVLIDFNQMLSVLTAANIIIVALIVLGAVLGSATFGFFVKFWPIESAITAGLCMANMGGAGDLAVLGAAKRMNLMSYAQISSRIGGAVVLLLGSVIFSFIS